MNKLRKGDIVIVTVGKDKGRQGAINDFVKKNGKLRATVDGLNIAKKHVKPNPQANETGGIVNKEMSIDVSNLMMYNPRTKKGDKVGIKLEDETGKKYRYFKSDGEKI